MKNNILFVLVLNSVIVHRRNINEIKSAEINYGIKCMHHLRIADGPKKMGECLGRNAVKTQQWSRRLA